MSNGLAFIASVALAANEELERIAPLLRSKTETKHPAQERSNTFVDDASQPVKRKRGRPKKYDRKPNEDENYELQTSTSKKTKKEDRYVDISFLPSSKHIDHSLIIWDDRKRSKPKKYTVDGEESDEERQVPNSQGNPPELQTTASVQPEVPQTLHAPVEVEKPKKPRVVKPKPPVIVDPNNPDAPLKRPRGRPRKNPDELSVPRKKPNSPTTQTPNGSIQQVTQVYAQPPRSALEEAVLPSVLLNGLVQMSQPTLLNSLPTANVTVAVKKLSKPNSQPGEQPRKRGRPRKYPLPAGQPAPRPKSVNQAILPPDSTPPVPFSLPSPSFPIVQNVSYNATPPIALPPLKFDLPTPQTQVALPPLKQMSIQTLVQSDSEPKPLPILSGIQSLYSEHPTPKPVAQAQIQEAPPQPPSPQALSPVQPESPPLPLESTRASNDQATTTNGACGVPLKKRFVKNYDLTPRMGGHLINSLVPHESAATAH